MASAFPSMFEGIIERPPARRQVVPWPGPLTTWLADRDREYGKRRQLNRAYDELERSRERLGEVLGEGAVSASEPPEIRAAFQLAALSVASGLDAAVVTLRQADEQWRLDVAEPEPRISLRALGLRIRTANVLIANEVTTVGRVLSFEREELVAFRGFGEVSLADLTWCLAQHQFIERPAWWCE